MSYRAATAVLALGLLSSLPMYVGCRTPRPIPEASMVDLDGENAGGAASAMVVLKAVVVGPQVAGRLFDADLAARSILPVVFAVTNSGTADLHLRREQFLLVVDDAHIEPVLPGRAANLLRADSEVDTATMIGFIAVGVLAAPSIDAAQRHQEAAVQGNLGRIFSDAEVAPAHTQVGYLFFETPRRLDQISTVRLQYTSQSPSETPPDSVIVTLANPYAD